MAENKIIVTDSKGNKRIVQPSMIPAGFKYVKDFKEPKKTSKKTESKQDKK